MSAAVLVLLLVPALASCMRSTTGKPDENWVVVPSVPYYVRLDDVNPGNVPEMRLGFGLDLQRFGYVETPDGILLATTDKAISVGFIASVREISGGTAGRIPRSRAAALAGIAQASSNTRAAGIVHSARVRALVQTYPYPEHGRYVYEPVLIVKCDKDGKEEWRQHLDDYDGDVARALLVAEDGQVFIVGDWRSEGGRQVDEHGTGDIDVVITKLAKDGTIVEQRSYGGSDDDEIYRAEYLDGVGLILLGTTASVDWDLVGTRASERTTRLRRIHGTRARSLRSSRMGASGWR